MKVGCLGYPQTASNLIVYHHAPHKMVTLGVYHSIPYTQCQTNRQIQIP